MTRMRRLGNAEWVGPALSTVAFALVVAGDPALWADRKLVVAVVFALAAVAWRAPRSPVGSLFAPVVIGLAGWVGEPQLLALVTVLAIASVAHSSRAPDAPAGWGARTSLLAVAVFALVASTSAIGPLGGDDESEASELVVVRPMLDYRGAELAYGVGPDPVVGLSSLPDVGQPLEDFQPGVGLGDSRSTGISLGGGEGQPDADRQESSLPLLWILALLLALASMVWLIRWSRSGPVVAPRAVSSGAPAALGRLERLGRGVGRPRGHNEPPMAFASALATRTGDERYRVVGRLLSGVLYEPGHADDARLAALLDDLESGCTP